MAAVRIFGVHRTWEELIGIVTGALIVISPWLANAFDFSVGGNERGHCRLDCTVTGGN